MILNNQNHFTMAAECALDQLSTNTQCGNRGGIRIGYWTKYENIDWDAMATDPLKFDPVTKQILGYTMVGGATWNKVSFNKKSGFYNFDYTSETQVFTQLVQMFFFGKTNERKNALDAAIACCSVVAHLFGTDGQQRVPGVEWNGTGFEEQTEPLVITRISDTSVNEVQVKRGMKWI